MSIEKQPGDRDYFEADNNLVRSVVNTVDIPAFLATSPASTDAQMRDYIDDLDQKKDRVETLVAEAQVYSATTGSPIEQVPPASKPDAAVVRRSIIRLFQFLSADQAGALGGLPGTILSPQSKNLILRMDHHIGDKLSESSAIVIFPMVQKLLNGPLSQAQLEEEFDKMQGRMAKSTLEKIGKAVVDRYTDYGYATVADAENRFVNNIVDPLRGNLQNVNKPLTASEQARYDDYLDRINQNYPPSTITDTDERERLAKKLWADIKKKDKAAVSSQLGWTNADVDELFSLDRDVLVPKRGDDILSDYGIHPTDLVMFDPNHIDSNFVKYFNNERGVWRANEHFRAELIKTLYDNTNKILQKASASPNSDWKDHFNDLVEGRAVRELKDRLTAIADDKRLISHFGGDEISKRALRDMILSTATEIDMEISMREALHTIRGVILYNRAGTKDIAGFIKAKFPASTITNMIHAYRGPLVGLARDQVVEYVKERLLENNGVIPSDLFGSIFDAQYRYNQPDQRNMRDDYIEKLEMMKNDSELQSLNPGLFDLLQEPMEPWMHEREIAMGLTIALIADMRIIEELATAKASPDFSGGIVEFMAAFGFQPRIMRGPGINELPGLLRTIVPITEEQRKKRRSKGHPNVLTRHRRNRNKIKRDVGYDTIDQEAEEGITFVNAIRDVASFSNQSKGSWRNGSLKFWANNEGAPIGGSAKSWRIAYDNLLRKAGVGSRWGFDKSRVDDEVRHFRLNERYPNYETRYTSTQIDVLWANMNRAVSWDKMSSEEAKWEKFKLRKVRCYQGMNFLATLDRAPGDFIVRLATLEPEIMATKKDSSGKSISAYEFYFGSAGKLNNIQRQDRNSYIEKLEYKWGKENAPHIARIMKYWDRAYAHYYDSSMEASLKTSLEAEFLKKNSRPPNSDEKKVLHEKAIEKTFSSAVKSGHKRTYKVMGAALGSVKMKNKPRMDEGDLGGNNPTDPELAFFQREFLMNGDGLQNYFHGLGEKFGNEEGQEGQLGDKGFFYTLAARWCDIEQRKIIPSTSDIRLEPQYDNISKIGESALFRQMDDPEGFSESIKTMPIIDQLYRSEARGDPKQMMELLESIKTLAGKEGNDGMWKAMWTVVFPRLEFFQRTGHAIANPMWNYKTASDSKMAFGPKSVDYVTEQLRMLAMECGEKGYLPWTGPYSVESLMYVLRIDTMTYVTAEVIPTSLLVIMFMFLGQQALKSYQQEFELSQKKAA